MTAAQPRAPLMHWTRTGCLLAVPGDGRTVLAVDVTCPSCREDALRAGAGVAIRDYARPFSRRSKIR